MSPESFSSVRNEIPKDRSQFHFATPFRVAAAIALTTNACNLSNQQVDHPSRTGDANPAATEAGMDHSKSTAKQDRKVRLALERHDQESPEFNISLAEAVMLRAKEGLLPPPQCVNTGWVYFNGEDDYPSSMTIRTECEQVFELGILAYSGEGVTVTPDAHGRFPLPYEGTSVAIKDGMPVIFYPHRGQEEEGDLVPDDHETRLFSYAPYRRQGYLTPIIEEDSQEGKGK